MSIGRPLTFDPDIVLLQAMKLFWEKGYEATSTQDLMSVMGLSKSSLYQRFGSKHALFEQCLALYGKQVKSVMTKNRSQAASAKQFLEQILLSAACPETEEDRLMGCFFVNSTCELAGHNDATVARIKKRVDVNTTILQQAVEKAQIDGEIDAKKNAQEISALLMTNLCGLRVMSKMGMDRTALKASVNQLFNSL